MPMWDFWWIFPLTGLLICILFVLIVVRAMAGGGRFMCMRPHHDDYDELLRLRREVQELREQIKGGQAAR